MAELIEIPLNLVTPHPKLATRLKMDVRPLAELIRGAADEDVPNGQLEPGRVVPREDGKGYYVYIGVRRFYALKSLFEETRDKRFAVFVAFVDATKSLLELFLRVRAENEDGRGERVGLSVLERVYGLHRISGLVPLDEMDAGMKRELAVAEKLDEKRIMKLFEIETAAHFSFRLEHLERLCQISDPRELYESAAATAGYAIPPERMEKAVEGREDAVRTLKWFGRMFPDYAKGAEDRRAGERQSSVQLKLEPKKEESAAIKERDSEQGTLLEVHKREVLIVPCPKCAVENMVQVRLKAEVTRLAADPEGASLTVVPDALVSCRLDCSGCGSGFHAFIKPLEGRRYAVETSLSGRFRDPEELVESVDLRFDFQKGDWQKLAGERVVGVVRTVARPK